MQFVDIRSAAAIVALMLAAGCGGGTMPSAPSPSPAPTPAPAPATPAPAPSSQATVDIVGSVGRAAFTPNPVAVAAGSAVVWKNDDSTLHHIVLDNGTDVGNVNPGATSRAVTVASSAPLGFHCTIHPSMVGTINASGAPSPPDPNTPY